jgi:hypothetical protein
MRVALSVAWEEQLTETRVPERTKEEAQSTWGIIHEGRLM